MEKTVMENIQRLLGFAMKLVDWWHLVNNFKETFLADQDWIHLKFISEFEINENFPSTLTCKFKRWSWSIYEGNGKFIINPKSLKTFELKSLRKSKLFYPFEEVPARKFQFDELLPFIEKRYLLALIFFRPCQIKTRRILATKSRQRSRFFSAF